MIKRFFAVLMVSLIITMPMSFAISITSSSVATTQDSAELSFTTNVNSKGHLNYGITSVYDFFVSSPNVNSKVHSIKLSGLRKNGRYFYRFVATDSSDDNAQAVVSKSFKILDDIDPLQVANVRTKVVTTTSITIEWDAIVLDKDLEKYKVFRNNVEIGEVDRLTTSFEDTGLRAGSSYTYQVEMIDVAGYKGDKSDALDVTTEALDITPPSITYVRLLSVSATSATFGVTNNEDVNVVIKYGIKENDLNGQITSDQFKKDHTLTVTQLQKDVFYYYQAKVCDKSNNCVSSAIESFKGGEDATPPYINVTLPEFHNEFTLDIVGEAEPLSQIQLFVGKSRDSLDFAKTDGKFKLRATSLERGENIIKFVAKDPAGNSNDVSFTLFVDDQQPKVNMTNIPEVTFLKKFSIDGVVDEEVIVTLGVGGSQVQPDRVKNVESTIVESSKISFKWDEVNGVSKYVVYRRDIGAIAIVEQPKFEDTTVKPGVSYIYEVSAMRNNGVEGRKSSVLTLSSLSGADSSKGDAVLIDKNDFVDDGRVNSFVVKDGLFKFDLDLVEGDNLVRINIEDRSGNKVSFEKNVLVDTIPPVILEPTDFTIYSPAFSPGLDIKGRVDTPNATVIVTVNDATDAGDVIPTSLSGVFEHFANKKDSYIVTADEEGNFEITVELSRIRIPQKSELPEPSQAGFRAGDQGGRAGINTGGDRAELFDPSLFVDNNIKIIAMDRSGQQSQPLQGIVQYRSCGRGGNWKVRIPDEHFTPKVIYSEHLLRGLAQFGFNVEIEYSGPGDKKAARVTSEPVITEFPLSQADQKKYGYRTLLKTPTTSWNDDYSKGHLLYQLDKWPESEEKLETVKRLKFPVMLQFSYEQDNFGKTIRGVQKECVEDFSIEMEHRLNVEKHIPEDFLRNSVGFLNSTVNSINKILPRMQQVQTVLLFSCLGSWFVLWVANNFNKWGCVPYYKQARVSLAVKENWPGINTAVRAGTVQPCPLDGADSAACLSCVAGLERFRTWNEKMHLLCDRTMCQAVPTPQLHAETYKDDILYGVVPGATTKNACEGMVSDYYAEQVTEAAKTNVLGLAGVSQQIGQVASALASNIKTKEACKKEYKREWDNACLGMDEWKVATLPQSAFSNIYSAVVDMCDGDADMEGRQTKRTIKSGGSTKDYIYGRDAEGNPYLEAVTSTEEDIIKKEDGTYVSSGDGKRIKTTPLTNEYQKFVDCEDNGGDCSSISAEHKNAFREFKRDNSLEKSGKKYVVNPTSGIARAVQCVCIPTITGFLEYWRNVMTAIQKCFQSILVTKNAQSGLCRSVLTSYVCDALYDAFSCLTKRFSNNDGAAVSISADSTGVGGFMTAMSQSSNEVQNAISNRYGKTSVFRNLFNDRKIVHSICLAAFTGDWDLDMEGLISGAMRVPIASEGFIPVSTRRFVTSDPLNEGLTTHIYHLGVGLIAGSDLDYNLELVCSNDNSCPDSGNPGGRCDCSYIGQEMTYNINGGSLQSGDTLGSTDTDGDLYVSLEQPYRFDKVRLVWRYVDNQNEQVEDREVNDIKPIGGRAPAGCEFSVVDGTYSCEAILQEGGRAKFTSKPRTKQVQYAVGEPIELDIRITKKSPGFKKSDTKTKNKQIPYWLGYQVINHHHNVIPMAQDGEVEVASGWAYVPLRADGIYSNEVPFGEDTEAFKLHIPGISVKEEHFGTSMSNPIKPNIAQMPGKDLLNVEVQPSVHPDPKIFKLEFTTNSDYVLQFGELNGPTFRGTGPVVPGQYRGDPIIFDTFSIRPSDSDRSGKVAVIVYSPPTQTRTKEACRDSIWKVDLKLLKSAPDRPEEPLSYSNARRSNDIAIVNGKKQEFTGRDGVPVEIVCKGEKAKVENEQTTRASVPGLEPPNQVITPAALKSKTPMIVYQEISDGSKGPNGWTLENIKKVKENYNIGNPDVDGYLYLVMALIKKGHTDTSTDYAEARALALEYAREGVNKYPNSANTGYLVALEKKLH